MNLSTSDLAIWNVETFMRQAEVSMPALRRECAHLPPMGRVCRAMASVDGVRRLGDRRMTLDPYLRQWQPGWARAPSGLSAGWHAEELMTHADGSQAGRAPWPGGAAWIGEYCPIEEAKISVLDLGVTRSDATYDVVHVWRGRFYRLADHLDRFAASCARLRLDPGYDRVGIEAILHGCVRRTGLREAYVSMTCTRGRLAAGSRDLRTARCTFYCYAVPFVWIATPGQQDTGASLWISQVTRIPPRSVDPLVKNYHWLDMEVAQLDAYDHSAQLVILRDDSGAITEGPGFNVFAYVDGRWLTPASGTLAGITRRSLIELAAEAGDLVQQGRLSASDLRRAAEVLITSTAGGIMPVTLVDGQPVGPGTPGPLTTSLRERYWARHEDPRFSSPVRYGG
jgi:branched-chain amino acid aminotransferase